MYRRVFHVFKEIYDFFKDLFTEQKRGKNDLFFCYKHSKSLFFLCELVYSFKNAHFGEMPEGVVNRNGNYNR